ncbi:MAG: alpha/beta hydrolase [Lachnospiraceae bacterium]|nr:alpha/beta hydrolase [Lachnospiraceae bacterium]
MAKDLKNIKFRKIDTRVKEKVSARTKLRRFLNKFFKIFIIFMIATAFINGLLLLLIYANHKSKLKNEKTYLVAPGQLVDVDGYKMHVYVYGNDESEDTLVFMHSTTIVDDSIALQPLFDELKDDYRLVLIERSGYGFSEVSGKPRDIDTILEDSRAALKAVGIEEKLTLVPIGTGSIEAFHWVNKYPDEIKSIIGINVTYPEQFASITQDEYCGFFDYLMVKFCKIGGQRLLKSVYPANQFGLYTDMQMKVREALVSKGGYTEDMYNEDLATVDNANKVAAEGFPEKIDIYMIYANPIMDPYRSENEDVNESYNDQKKVNEDFDYINAYNEEPRNYFSKYDNVTFEELSGPARLYTYNPKELAIKIADFMQKEQ